MTVAYGAHVQTANCGVSAVAVSSRSSTPLSWRRGSLSWSRAFAGTIDVPQLLCKVIDVPVVQVEQVHFPVVTQRPIPMARPVGGP